MGPVKRLAFGFVLIFLTAPANAADRLPKEMLGAWASDPAACGEQASELGLTVEPKTLLFYEHGLEIKRVTRLRNGSLKASGFAVDDDGRARSSMTLKLVGDKLHVDDGIYHRCKK
jgi:hypothetical protein